MGTLARFGGLLALLGGALWIIAGLLQATVPTAPTWIGSFASILLIGGAAVGLQQQVGERSGRPGRWGAAATGVGAVALIACVLVVIATGQVNATTPPPDILVALSLLSALVWFVGGLVFALGLMRAKAISPMAGWLVVLGAVIVPVLVIAIPQDPPPFVYVPLVLYGVGWMLVGYEARKPMAEVGIAGQAT
jgi:hypothetical protein